MNIQTRNQAKEIDNQQENSDNRLRNRKRYRNPDFDLNRSTNHTQPKQKRIYEMNDSNMNKLRSKLTQPITEYDMIKIMKRNINLNLGLIVYPIAVSSVEQLRIECNEAERNFPRRDVRNPLPNSKIYRQINELYFEEVDENEVNRSNVIEINALKSPHNNNKNNNISPNNNISLNNNLNNNNINSNKTNQQGSAGIAK